MPRIQTLEKNSAVFRDSRKCSYCHNGFNPGGEVIFCPVCDAVHHVECWRYNGNKCAVLNCSGSGPLQDKKVLDFSIFASLGFAPHYLLVVLLVVFIVLGVFLSKPKTPKATSDVSAVETLTLTTLSAKSPVTPSLTPAPIASLDMYGELTVVRIQKPDSDFSHERRTLCKISYENGLDNPALDCSLGSLNRRTVHLDWDSDGKELVAELVYTAKAEVISRYLRVYTYTSANNIIPHSVLPIGHARRPRWRPGHPGEIAYEMQNGEHIEIHVASTVNSNPYFAITITGNNIWPSWSPDGEYLLFSNDFHGAYQVYRTEHIERPSELRYLIDAVPISQEEGACRGAVMGHDGTIAYICQNGDEYALQMIGPQDQRTRVAIPGRIRPRGYLVWLPNKAGYVFECEPVTPPDNVWRSDICLVNTLDQTVKILPLPQEHQYISPAWRPLAVPGQESY